MARKQTDTTAATAGDTAQVPGSEQPAAPTPDPTAPGKVAAAAPGAGRVLAALVKRQAAEGIERSKAEYAAGLLMEACRVFGINPDPDAVVHYPNRQKSPEVASWKFYPSPDTVIEPDAVVLVTAGGVKLKYYTDGTVDQATEDTLARVFNAFRRDAQGNVIRIPLPDDLSLPTTAVTGLGGTTDHRYERGYLREGGKEEGARRAATRTPVARRQ